ncbi:MAG: N-acetyl-alpha-D-glucosaminyl L-malate synthase BshA [Planctomycetia bacterium]
MKVGIVCYPTFGGSGVVATELARGLAGREHEVHLFSYAPPARLPDLPGRITFHEVEVSTYPLFRYPPYEVALASRLTETAEEAGLDLVHVHYAIPHALAALLVKDILAPRALPVVTTLHGTDITVVGQDRSYRRVTEHALTRSDAVTAVSGWLRDETLKVFGCTRTIDVVPNFVDTERFQPRAPGLEGDLRRKAWAAPHEALLVHVGNFRPVKRARRVVEAFAQVQAARPGRLLMVGDGPERAECEALARTLRVHERVRFLGSTARIEDLLPLADLLLLPSEHESFGLSALEAMACGVVPVASRAGGLPEVVDDGSSGLLVEGGESAAMAAAALALLEDAPRRAAMAAAARRAAVERFSPERALDRYEAIYARVVGAPSGPA